ncbi:hypothetical protein SAMN02910369_02409 [Lachnospiraceae bacterium NE2001]|nr:hypothetical protein SAMN02910369_02409 [Lachnospiraceae bacterium NE2001]
MLEDNVKKPMIVGVILYGVVFFINVLCSLTQFKGGNLFLTSSYMEAHEATVIPLSLFSTFTHLLMLVIFMLIMFTYKGDSRRSIEIVMFIVYILLGWVLGIVSGYLGNFIYAKKGTEYLAAYNAMNNVISLISAPFLSVSGILIVVAIGRYGVTHPWKQPGEMQPIQ